MHSLANFAQTIIHFGVTRDGCQHIDVWSGFRQDDDRTQTLNWSQVVSIHTHFITQKNRNLFFSKQTMMFRMFPVWKRLEVWTRVLHTLGKVLRILARFLPRSPNYVRSWQDFAKISKIKGNTSELKQKNDVDCGLITVATKLKPIMVLKKQ